jgi:RNA polymerase sigma-70 factor, ECF subfamily
MGKVAKIFESHRARLFAIALRMLRNRADAEDVLQDAYLRWHEAAEQNIQSPTGFLITTTTRLCLDRLRNSKKEHEHYMEPLLTPPSVDACVPSPEEQHEIAGEVSVAFLAVLERLSPQERAAFLLREVFDYDYPEVAKLIGKSEATCRQLVHRALPRVREGRPRNVVTAESRERLLKKFFAASESGDRKAVMALLAEEVQHMDARSGMAIASTGVGRASRRTPLGSNRPQNVSSAAALIATSATSSGVA